MSAVALKALESSLTNYDKAISWQQDCVDEGEASLGKAKAKLRELTQERSELAYYIAANFNTDDTEDCE